jgi:hypothetical protein
MSLNPKFSFPNKVYFVQSRIVCVVVVSSPTFINQQPPHHISSRFLVIFIWYTLTCYIFVKLLYNYIYLYVFHTSVQNPVACIIEVTINTVNATFFVLSFYWTTLFHCDMFRFSFEPSSGNMQRTFTKLYLYVRTCDIRALQSFVSETFQCPYTRTCS